jgi:hypothetical protein
MGLIYRDMINMKDKIICLAAFFSMLFGMFNICLAMINPPFPGTFEPRLGNYKLCGIGKALEKNIAVKCRFNPTNVYCFQIAPIDMEQKNYNHHVIELDCWMLESVKQKLQDFDEKNPGETEFGLLLQKDYLGMPAKIFPVDLYAIQRDQFNKIYSEYLQRHEAKNERRKLALQEQNLKENQQKQAAQQVKQKEIEDMKAEVSIKWDASPLKPLARSFMKFAAGAAFLYVLYRVGKLPEGALRFLDVYLPVKFMR